MIFYFVRHGDPIYDPDSLTPLGAEQAKSLSKRFALYGLDEIYASTSNRAQLTAKPTCALLKKEMTLLDWANEGYAWQDFTVTLADGSVTWSFYDPATKEKFRADAVRTLGKLWYTHPSFAGRFDHGVRRIDTCVDEWFERLGYKHDRANNRFESVAPSEKRVASIRKASPSRREH